MDIIEFNGKQYPALQAHGFAAQYSFAFAEKILKGVGVDVGCNRKEWALPGAIPIDTTIADEYHALNIPLSVDFIFSSHCLEHLNDWVGVLNYWASRLKPGGICFLYLPHCDFQEYWQPQNNRKHVNWLRPDMLRAYFEKGGIWKNIFVTGHDLNYSFYAVAEKV